MTRADESDPNLRPKAIFGAVIFFAVWLAALAACAGGFFFGMIWMAKHHVGAGAAITATVAYCVVILALSILPFLWSRRRATKPLPPEAKRYVIGFMSSMGVYALSLVVVIFVFVLRPPTGVLAYVIAALPAIPMVAVIGFIGIFVRDIKDEFQRAMMVQAMIWAMGGTMAICTVWGFLETFGLVPHVWSWGVFPLFAVCLGPAVIAMRIKYR